ncbi:hypothetical protein, partial [Atlantibacter sp.]|uniref:hypothetical protein n=1 Tax=Atlantibacter sp. TaxID=1903473 RepID=UPI0028AB7D5A
MRVGFGWSVAGPEAGKSLRHYRITALRHYGITALRHYDITTLRHYDITAVFREPQTAKSPALPCRAFL